MFRSTARPHLSRRSFERDEDADLVVVGGGLTGLWTAIEAKNRDPAREVVVLEGERVAFGASGRNGGFCDASLTHGIENGMSRWPGRCRARADGQGKLRRDAGFPGSERDRAAWDRPGPPVATEEHQVAG